MLNKITKSQYHGIRLSLFLLFAIDILYLGTKQNLLGISAITLSALVHLAETYAYEKEKLKTRLISNSIALTVLYLMVYFIY